MLLILKRIAKKADYTIGKLYVDGEYFCDTLEDTDRGLALGQTYEYIMKTKIKGKTAIPKGRYKMVMNVVSPRFAKSAQYKNIGGKLPRLLGVPGFDGILIHIGNTAKDTDGCILVGQNKIVGQVVNSKATFFDLYKRLSVVKSGIEIEIK